jgi:serine/threonine-protein kinase HipA
MTSRPAPTECFVYITLPGATAAVTAARFQLTTNRNGVPLGRLVYGKSYLARRDAVAIDPVELTLGPRIYETIMMKGVGVPDKRLRAHQGRIHLSGLRS